MTLYSVTDAEETDSNETKLLKHIFKDMNGSIQ